MNRFESNFLTSLVATHQQILYFSDGNSCFSCAADIYWNVLSHSECYGLSHHTPPLESCWVWLSVTRMTCCVEELTDDKNDRGVLLWRVYEGQNIRINLSEARAALSATVAVSSVFMAWLPHWMKAMKVSGRSCFHPAFDGPMCNILVNLLFSLWLNLNMLPINI